MIMNYIMVNMIKIKDMAKEFWRLINIYSQVFLSQASLKFKIWKKIINQIWIQMHKNYIKICQIKASQI
jgi:hypothetical protein